MAHFDRTTSRKMVVPLIALVALAVLNFVSFFIVSSRLGGDALNGKVENGRYYVGSHGRFREVSAGVFAYSRWHAGSLFVTHPLGMCAMAALALMLRDSLAVPPRR